MQLDGCGVVRHDERQQRMDLFGCAGMLNDCTEQARAHPVAVRCGINVDRGLVVPQPHLGIAVGAVESPTQVRAVVSESHEAGAAVAA